MQVNGVAVERGANAVVKFVIECGARNGIEAVLLIDPPTIVRRAPHARNCSSASWA